MGTQFANFRPDGTVSDSVKEHIDQATESEQGSDSCIKLAFANIVAGGLIIGSITPIPGIYGMKTKDTASPGRSFVILPGVPGSGNDFYGLSDTYLGTKK